MPTTETVGDRIKRIRTEKGLKPQDLSYRTGISQLYIDDAEKGREPLPGPMIRALAAELGVSETWLRTGEGSPEGSIATEALRMASMLEKEAPEGPRYRVCKALEYMTDEEVASLANLCEAIVDKRR